MMAGKQHTSLKKGFSGAKLEMKFLHNLNSKFFLYV